MQPTVGRIVHYHGYGTPGGAKPTGPLAAMVTGVDGDEADLTVFFLNDMWHESGVRFAEIPTPGCWNWPPRTPDAPAVSDSRATAGMAGGHPGPAVLRPGLTSRAVDLALADMRNGLRVLVIAANERAVTALLDYAGEQLQDSEKMRRTQGTQRIAGSKPGVVVFISYADAGNTGGGRGLSLDSVYVDHTALWNALAPTMIGKPGGPDITHC